MEINLSLHAKQGVAFLSEATEILYGGAAGGGKSYLFRAAGISWCYEIPNLQVYLFRRTSPDLWKNHMEGPGGFPALLAPWIDEGIVNINYSKGFIEFWNKAKIHLCHCQYEKDVLNYQGAEIHVLMIDELTQWLWSMYTYLRGRVRVGGLDIPSKYKGLFPRILTGANPGGIGHNSVKAEFVDIAPPLQITHMPKKEGGLRRQYIPALLEDNPTLLENDPDYEYRLDGLGSEDLVKALRHGIWDIVAGGAVDDVWSRDRHVLRPFIIPKSWRIDRSFDWGSSKPFSVGWWAEADGTTARLHDGKERKFPKGTLFRIVEYYGWNGKPNKGCKKSAKDVAKEINRIEKEHFLLRNHVVHPGPADPAIYTADDEGKSHAKKMLSEGVKWKKGYNAPGSREVGLQDLRDMLQASLQKEMEEPGIFIFENCTHFVRTIPVLPRDPKKPDDVDTHVEDHVYDETRYKITTKKRLTSVHDLPI